MAKIMLVEDDNNLREIYGARLMAEGYEIVSAKDGEEALALAVKERPELIISDIMMPKISGFDMLDILRETPETKNTKVIMMTALSQAEDKTRADALGADLYLVKSQVTLEDVAKAVKDVLEGADTTATTTTEAIAPYPAASDNPVLSAPPPPAEPAEPAVAAVAATPAVPPVTDEPATTPTPVTDEPPVAMAPSAGTPAVEEPVLSTAATAATDDTSVKEAADEAAKSAPTTKSEEDEINHQIEDAIAHAGGPTPEATPRVETLTEDKPAESEAQLTPEPAVTTPVPGVVEPLTTETPNAIAAAGSVIAPAAPAVSSIEPPAATPEPAPTPADEAETESVPPAPAPVTEPAAEELTPAPPAPAVAAPEMPLPAEPEVKPLETPTANDEVKPLAEPPKEGEHTETNEIPAEGAGPQVKAPGSPFKSDVDPNQIAL